MELLCLKVKLVKKTLNCEYVRARVSTVKDTDYKEVHSQALEQIVNSIPSNYNLFPLWDL